MKIGLDPDRDTISLLKESYLGKNVIVKYGPKAAFQKEGILDSISIAGISLRYESEENGESGEKKKQAETNFFLSYEFDIDIDKTSEPAEKKQGDLETIVKE